MTTTKKPDDPSGLLPRNRFALVLGLVVVGVFGIGAAATILALRDRLPDPVATHFGGGTPNGYESVTATAIIALVFTLGLGLLFVAIGAMMPGNRWVRRTMFGLGLGTAVFISLTFLAMTIPQMDLTDAQDARMEWTVFLIPLAVSSALGWVLSLLIRE